MEGVSSPTFTIIQVYRGPLTLHHVDLYRLESNEVDDLGLEDLAEESVMAIEWPERWRRAPSGTIDVSIEAAGESERRIAVSRDGQAPICKSI